MHLRYLSLSYKCYLYASNWNSVNSSGLVLYMTLYHHSHHAVLEQERDTRQAPSTRRQMARPAFTHFLLNRDL
jgi:hypothetical protein